MNSATGQTVADGLRRSLVIDWNIELSATLAEEDENIFMPRTVGFDRSWPMRRASDSDAGRIRHVPSQPREALCARANLERAITR